MSPKLPRISPVQMRKDLLIAESELNRAQLVEEWEAATDWHRRLSAGARTAGSVVSAAALLVSGVRAFRRKRTPKNGPANSWLQLLLQGAGLIASICEIFRSSGCPEKDE